MMAGWEDDFWLHTAWLMPIDLSVVYFNAFYLVPRLLLCKRYKTFIIAFLLTLVGFVVFERIVYYYQLYPMIYPKGLEKPLFYFPSLLNIFIGMYSFVFLFSGVQLFSAWIRDQRRQEKLEKQSLSSELALLRSQVNPHFLFNTLNNIDSLVFIDQQRASDAIVKLSEIMRYMLYEANGENVLLEKEIHYLESMIDLLRLRLRNPNFIQLKIEGNPAAKKIPPMLIVPFVENAYKHGRKSGPAPGITVYLRIDPGKYYLEVHNKYDQDPEAQKDRIGGIGLTNVRRRLDLLYGEQYRFEIQNEAPDFCIRLEVPDQCIIKNEDLQPETKKTGSAALTSAAFAKNSALAGTYNLFTRSGKEPL